MNTRRVAFFCIGELRLTAVEVVVEQNVVALLQVFLKSPDSPVDWPSATDPYPSYDLPNW